LQYGEVNTLERQIKVRSRLKAWRLCLTVIIVMLVLVVGNDAFFVLFSFVMIADRFGLRVLLLRGEDVVGPIDGGLLVFVAAVVIFSVLLLLVGVLIVGVLVLLLAVLIVNVLIVSVLVIVVGVLVNVLVLVAVLIVKVLIVSVLVIVVGVLVTVLVLVVVLSVAGRLGKVALNPVRDFLVVVRHGG
jgi:hypothetical protein